MPLSTLDLPPTRRHVHLPGFGFILVLRMVTPNSDAKDWATNDLSLPAMERAEVGQPCWAIERYHRGLKQCCGVERAHVRKAAAQWQHILLAVRALVRVEVHRVHTGIHGYTAKASLIRDAMRHKRAHPTIDLDPTAEVLYVSVLPAPALQQHQHQQRQERLLFFSLVERRKLFDREPAFQKSRLLPQSHHGGAIGPCHLVRRVE